MRITVYYRGATRALFVAEIESPDVLLVMDIAATFYSGSHFRWHVRPSVGPGLGWIRH